MTKASVVLTALALLLLSAAVPSHVRAQTLLGPHAGYDYDLREAFLGASLRVPVKQIGRSSLAASPSFDIYPFLGTGKSFWVANLDVLYSLATQFIEPYAGAGVLLSRAAVDIGVFGTTSDVDVGLNLKGGVRFGGSMIQPFGEVVFKVADSSTLLMKGGLAFSLTR
jgi:opacity protein-like surface antigen